MTAEKLTSILDSLLSLPAETEVVEFKEQNGISMIETSDNTFRP